MYYRIIATKEYLEGLSNYELLKMRRQLMSSLNKADTDKIKMQHLLEVHPDILTPPEIWVEDEEIMFRDDLDELILVLEEIRKREKEHKWAWEEE